MREGAVLPPTPFPGTHMSTCGASDRFLKKPVDVRSAELWKFLIMDRMVSSSMASSLLGRRCGAGQGARQGAGCVAQAAAHHQVPAPSCPNFASSLRQANQQHVQGGHQENGERAAASNSPVLGVRLPERFKNLALVAPPCLLKPLRGELSCAGKEGGRGEGDALCMQLTRCASCAGCLFTSPPLLLSLLLLSTLSGPPLSEAAGRSIIAACAHQSPATAPLAPAPPPRLAALASRLRRQRRPCRRPRRCWCSCGSEGRRLVRPFSGDAAGASTNACTSRPLHSAPMQRAPARVHGCTTGAC